MPGQSNEGASANPQSLVNPPAPPIRKTGAPAISVNHRARCFGRATGDSLLVDLKAFVVKAPGDASKDSGHNLLVQANDSNVIHVDEVACLERKLRVENDRSTVIMKKAR